jgi:hypothetical protein
MKFRVVTRLMEKEAEGGKGLAYDKSQHGFSKSTKVPYLDVDLFHKDFNTKECVYCGKVTSACATYLSVCTITYLAASSGPVESLSCVRAQTKEHENK